jgi:hypothetical protein
VNNLTGHEVSSRTQIKSSAEQTTANNKPAPSKSLVKIANHSFLSKAHGSLAMDAIISKLELHPRLSQSEALAVCRAVLDEAYKQLRAFEGQKEEFYSISAQAKQTLSLIDQTQAVIEQLESLLHQSPSILHRSGIDRNTCDGLLLHSKALVARRPNVKAVFNQNGGRPTDHTARILIRALARIWVLITGRVPEATRETTRQEQGPTFPSFVEAFCKDANLRRGLTRMVKTVISHQRPELVDLMALMHQPLDKNSSQETR